MKKRLLGILLSFALMLTMIPGMSLTVFAAETTIRCEGTAGSIKTMFPQNGIDRHRNSFGDTDSQLVNSSTRWGDVYFIAPEGKCFTKIVVTESANNDGEGADCWTGWQGRAINVSQAKYIIPSMNTNKIIIDFTVDDLAIYNVTLNTNGGTVNDGNISTYTEFKGATLPANVTRNGYTFEGWYDNAGLTGEPVTAIASDATGEKAFWASWTKTSATVTKAPEAKTLTYNGQAQDLVTAGEAEDDEMQYALGENATTAPTSGWGTSIPTKTEAGTYYVWYKAVGNGTYEDSEPACVTVTINAPAPAAPTAPTALTAPTAPTAVELTVNAKTVSAKTLNAAVAKAGISSDTVTTIVIGKKVKKIKKGSFRNLRNASTLVVKSKKLTRARVKGSLKGSSIKNVKVNVGKKKTNKYYVKRYKKIFTKKNCGKKVRVRR